MRPLRRESGNRPEKATRRQPRAAQASRTRRDDAPRQARLPQAQPAPRRHAAAPVSPDAILMGMDRAAEGDLLARRAAAEAELARWPLRLRYSIPRLLLAIEDETPMEGLARWMRRNCRGAWALVNVPAGGGYVCMRDERCASDFRLAFGA